MQTTEHKEHYIMFLLSVAFGKGARFMTPYYKLEFYSNFVKIPSTEQVVCTQNAKIRAYKEGI